MLRLTQIMENYNISYHPYADAVQLYITVSSHDDIPLNLQERCIKQINKWICHFLQLNTEKTEIIVSCSKGEGLKVSAHLESMTLYSYNQVRIIGVAMDSDQTSTATYRQIQTQPIQPSEKHSKD